MTALRFQTGGRHQTSTASLRGLSDGLTSSTCVYFQMCLHNLRVFVVRRACIICAFLFSDGLTSFTYVCLHMGLHHLRVFCFQISLLPPHHQCVFVFRWAYIIYVLFFSSGGLTSSTCARARARVCVCVCVCVCVYGLTSSTCVCFHVGLRHLCVCVYVCVCVFMWAYIIYVCLFSDGPGSLRPHHLRGAGALLEQEEHEGIH